MQQPSTLKLWVAAFAIVFITAAWGLTFILVKWAIAEMDLYYFLFIRFSAAFLLMAVLFPKALVPKKKGAIKASLWLSLFLGSAYIAQTEGLVYTTASNVSLITGLYMLIIPIILLIFWREKTAFFVWVSALFAFAGLYMLSSYSVEGSLFGDFLTLINAVIFAFHIVFVGRYAKEYTARTLVLYQFLFVALMCGTMTLIKGSWTPTLPPIAWLTLAVCVLFATVAAFMVQIWVQRIIDPARIGIFFTLESVFGLFFACWLGDETLSFRSGIGVALMLLGMMLCQVPVFLKGIRRRRELKQEALRVPI